MAKLIDDYKTKWKTGEHVGDNTDGRPKVTISDNMSDIDLLELSEQLSDDDAYRLGRHLWIPDGLLRTWCHYDGGKSRWPWDVYHKWRQSHADSNENQLTDEVLTALRSIDLKEKADEITQQRPEGNFTLGELFVDIYEYLIPERRWYSLGEKLGLEERYLSQIDVCPQRTTPLTTPACLVLKYWKQMRLGKQRLIEGLKTIRYVDPSQLDTTVRLVVDIDLPEENRQQAEIFMRKMKQMIKREWMNERAPMNDMLVRTTVHVLQREDWVIKSIKEGSIIIEIRCKTSQSLDDLYKMVQSGDLAKRLQQDYLTPELQEKFIQEGCVLKVSLDTSSSDTGGSGEAGVSHVTNSLVVKHKSRSKDVCHRYGLTDVHIPETESLEEFITEASRKIKEENVEITDEQLKEVLRAKLDDVTSPGVEVEWTPDTETTEAESLDELFKKMKVSTSANIILKKVDGKTERLNVCLNDDVRSVKEQVAKQEGVTCDDVCLLYKGKVLSDEHSLSRFELQEGSTLHIRINRQSSAGLHIAKLMAKQQNLKYIQLGNNSLGDEGAVAIARYIADHKELTNIHLMDNNIGDAGAMAIAQALEKNSNLTHIYLSNNSIGDDGAMAIGKALANKSSGLIHIRLTQNMIGDAGAVAIGQALVNNTRLTFLYLSNNCIDDDGAIAIGHALAKNSSLTHLYLAHNSIGHLGARVIGDVLGKNRGLLHLCLSNNCIGDDGVRAIRQGLAENSRLTHLYLSNNRIRYGGALSIGYALEKNDRLTHLYLSSNCIGKDGGIAIGRGLSKNRRLTHLSVCNTDVQNRGAKAIGDALEMNNSLLHLNMSKNSTGDDGARAIGRSLAKNKSLMHLNLSSNFIGDEGAMGIGQGLAENKRLTHLDLSHNHIGDEGAEAIRQGTVHTHLKDIRLYGNSPGTVSAIQSQIKGKVKVSQPEVGASGSSMTK